MRLSYTYPAYLSNDLCPEKSLLSPRPVLLARILRNVFRTSAAARFTITAASLDLLLDR